MHTVHLRTQSRKSRICIGAELQSLPQWLKTDKAVIVTDERVLGLYGHLFPDLPVVKMGRGEGVKNLDTVQRIARELMELQVDRSWSLVGIGGGIACDLAGFVASIYMRGLGFAFVPTTLLAQVDASVGGKNGVNLDGYKNMLGVFRQPDFVLCDPRVLTTLEDVDLGCGLAEAVKHGAIADSRLFAYLEQRTGAALARDPQVLGHLVQESVRIKAGIVQEDERESGLRRVLNFGHTLAHALEKVSGLAHGQAVSQGMVAAATLSVQRGLLEQTARDRLVRLLTDLGLPARLQTPPKDLLQALGRDKKRDGDRLHFVLLQGLGRAVVQPLPLQELEQALVDMG